jgi:hypothetical protein
VDVIRDDRLITPALEVALAAAREAHECGKTFRRSTDRPLQRDH